MELETDKVNLEVPSPVSGVLSEINSKDGSTVEVGALLGSVSENGSSVEKKDNSEKNEIKSKKTMLLILKNQRNLKFLTKSQKQKKRLKSH